MYAISELGLPEDKRTHRFISLIFIRLLVEGDRNKYDGRKPETQKALIKKLFEQIESQLSIAPIDIDISIKEQAPFQWGFRGMTGDEVMDLKCLKQTSPLMRACLFKVNYYNEKISRWTIVSLRSGPVEIISIGTPDRLSIFSI